jgi:HAD superfamily hydrolase (TIGR01509 family)
MEISSASLDLADALYEEESDPRNNPFAANAPAMLAALAAAEIRTAVVSDIHFDLRPVFAAARLDQYVDSYVLSFQHGVQKPDVEIFRIALDALAIKPAEALMVGDRPSHDGGAVAAGVPTLLVPPLINPADERLHLVVAACGVR